MYIVHLSYILIFFFVHLCILYIIQIHNESVLLQCILTFMINIRIFYFDSLSLVYFLKWSFWTLSAK
jgi:hypothetical protein